MANTIRIDLLAFIEDLIIQKSYQIVIPISFQWNKTYLFQ